MTKKAAPKSKKTTTKKSARKKAVSRKSPAKKEINKKAKSTPFKSKLGHDPLAWISGDDAADLGIAFDDIDANVEQTLEELEQIIPAKPSEPFVAEATVEDIENTTSEAIEGNEAETVTAEVGADTTTDASQGWGLFDDEPTQTLEIETESEPAPAVVSDDGSWGLFGDEEPQPPVGEGVAWGLFADEGEGDAEVEHDAINIRLPAAFNVSEISKTYHDIDLKIHENHDIVLDASDVEVIDAAGLQLLYSVQKELKRHDCKLVIKDANENIESLSNSSLIREIVGVST